MAMNDEELRSLQDHLETTLASVLNDLASFAAQATGLQAQLMEVKARRAALPEPGDFRPRPSGQPPYDPPAVHGNGGDDLDSPST